MKSENLPVGEPETEFERGAGKGPFQCGNCVHMDKDSGTCHHIIMMAVSKQPRGKGGYPKVDDDDCCKFVRRPSR